MSVHVCFNRRKKFMRVFVFKRTGDKPWNDVEYTFKIVLLALLHVLLDMSVEEVVFINFEQRLFELKHLSEDVPPVTVTNCYMQW